MPAYRHPPAPQREPRTARERPDLEQIYAIYLDPIYRFLYARVGNREDAEDLTSQVFLRAFRKLDLDRAERSIASWLFTVACTVLADHWRREYRTGPTAELDEKVMAAPETPDASEDTEKLQLVDEVLARLSPRSRAVLELRFLHGYTVEETARTLGITAGNVKVIQHRSLARAADFVAGDARQSVAAESRIGQQKGGPKRVALTWRSVCMPCRSP